MLFLILIGSLVVAIGLIAAGGALAKYLDERTARTVVVLVVIASILLALGAYVGSAYLFVLQLGGMEKAAFAFDSGWSAFGNIVTLVLAFFYYSPLYLFFGIYYLYQGDLLNGILCLVFGALPWMILLPLLLRTPELVGVILIWRK